MNPVTDIKNNDQNGSDPILLIAVLLLLIVGTVMIFSSSSIVAQEKFGDGYYFLKKQLGFLLFGFVGMIFLSKMSYRYLRYVAYGGIVLSVVLLVLLMVPGLGVTVKGATRWLRVCGVSFQVSEVVKIALVIFMAHYLDKKREHRKEFTRFFPVPLVVTGIVLILVLRQPDFGTAVIMAAVVVTMFYLAGSRIIYLAGFFAALIPIGVILVLHESYRLKRVMTFLNPWDDPQGAGFHIIQSFISFGSGGIFGVGLGNSMQKLFYLPEPHTDFILSVIGEEAGFLGVFAVVLLFTVFIIRGFMISFHCRDLFGSLLAAGLTTIVALEAFINMAGVMGLIPTKGLVLPFLSYGGTSLVLSMALVGILLNISSQGGEEKPKVTAQVLT